MKQIILLLILLWCGHSFVWGNNSDSTITISGKADFLKTGDTIILRVYKYGQIHIQKPFNYELISVVHNQSFSFKWKGRNYPEYIDLRIPKHPNENLNLNGYVVEHSNRIDLKSVNGTLTLSENTGGSFKLQNELKAKDLLYLNVRQKLGHFNVTTLNSHFRILDSVSTVKLKILDQAKQVLSKSIYQFLLTDILAGWNCSKYYDIKDFGQDAKGQINPAILKSFSNYEKDHPDKIIAINGITSYSNNSLRYLILKYIVDSCLNKGTNFEIVKGMKYFKKHYQGILRDQLITGAMFFTENFPREFADEVSKLVPTIKIAEYRSLLTNTVSRTNGADAYNFTLKDINGKDIRLSDFKNKVAVIDFWFTGCGNCRQLAPYMVKIEKKFTNKPVVFIGISSDQLRSKWVESVQSGEYVSSKIINLFSNGKGTNDPVFQHYHILAYPTLVIISPQGKIVNIKTDPRDDNGNSLESKIMEILN